MRRKSVPLRASHSSSPSAEPSQRRPGAPVVIAPHQKQFKLRVLPTPVAKLLDRLRALERDGLEIGLLDEDELALELDQAGP